MRHRTIKNVGIFANPLAPGINVSLFLAFFFFFQKKRELFSQEFQRFNVQFKPFIMEKSELCDSEEIKNLTLVVLSARTMNLNSQEPNKYSLVKDTNKLKRKKKKPYINVTRICGRSTNSKSKEP